MGQLLEIANLEFRFGSREASLKELLRDEVLLKLENIFSETPTPLLHTRIRETLRFLYIATFSPGNLFFPGDREMDEIWHELIIDTSGYRYLCNELKAGAFIDHWGVTYEDYATTRNPESLHQERLSWLASYFHNFGAIEKQAFNVLPLAQSLCENLSLSLQELNQLAETLARIATSSESTRTFDFREFVTTKIAPNAQDLDKSYYIVKSVIYELMAGLRDTTKHPILLLTNDELELIFSESTSLGFTLGQHLAAVERLNDSPTWQQNNPEVWKQLSNGKMLCGLATTHLVKPGPPILTGKKTDHGYFINGSAPWSCGFKIFNYLVIGFNAGDEIIFATTEYPKTLSTDLGVKVTPHKLSCLNGTASVHLDFNNTFIDNKCVISTRQKSSEVKMRPSRYIGYEVGIGKSALAMTEKEASKSAHPKNQRVSKAAKNLNKRLNKIMDLRSREPMNPELGVLISEFNRDAVRLLSIVLGARALLESSTVCRWQLEIMLFDAVIQSPKSIEMKIERIERG